MDSIDTSGASLVDFWKRAGAKGEMNNHTATALRGAALQVISVLDDWQTVDVRTLVVGDVLRRWVNKNANKFKQGSLNAYARRWPIAVRSFLEYADDPKGWKAPASDKPVIKREKRNDAGAKQSSSPPSAPTGLTATLTSGPSEIHGRGLVSTGPGLVEYPFPLREGRLAYLRLPPDLKFSEIKRLTSFLNTLAVDDEHRDLLA
jgi:hypothetical protein